MAKKFDLYQELKELGFYEVDDEFGDVLRKDYEKETEVVWHGTVTINYSVRAIFNKDHKVVTVNYYQGSVQRKPHKTKTHLNEKRALNAIRDTVKHNGFEL